MPEGFSEFIYGIHDPGGEPLLCGKGWVVFTEHVWQSEGRDYQPWSAQGLGVLVRLNNGYGAEGAIPLPDKYDEFARRCAAFVRASRGCSLWIVGNEPNHAQERPLGQVVAAGDYAACFARVRAAIKTTDPQAQVITAAIAPWNVQSGDWLAYFEQMLAQLGPHGCDGIALHTYTHGRDPALVTSEATMDAPYSDRRFHFRAYQDFMARIPPAMRHLPVYITETNQGDGPWLDANNGWVQAAYEEIHRWNQQPGNQAIRCLALYRWADHDRWSFQHKRGVQEGLVEAVQRGYRWPQRTAAQADQGQQTQMYIPVVQSGQRPAQLVWDARLDKRHASLRPAASEDGGPVWRLARAEWLDEQQAQGRHHIFVDVLDAQGQRMVGVPVRFWWAGGQAIKRTEAKPGEPYAVDFPMYNPAPAYHVAIADGRPGDEIHGLGLGSIEQPGFTIHTSYRLVWQLAAEATQPATPISQPQPQPQKGDLVGQLAALLDLDPAVARAVLSVESAGSGFGPDGRLTIRFENHIFWQEWGKNHPDLFNQHFRFNRQGQPWTGHQWRPDSGAWRACHTSQAEEWAVFDFARRMDETAAMRSISMGAPQIMGFHHRRIHYNTVQEMFHSFAASVANQVVSFFFFLMGDSQLMEALRRRDFVAFARRYNGPGQAETYAGLLAAKLRE